MLCLAVLATGCSRSRTDLFVISSAGLALPDALTQTPPASLVGDQSAAVGVHRIKSGDSWIVGYREFEGGRRFGPTDQQYFVKVTLVFPGSERPGGQYKLGDQGVHGYWSTGRVMNGGRTGAYARLNNGQVEIRWLDGERFRLTLRFDLKAQDILPSSSDRKAVVFAKSLDGRMKVMDQLTPWEGGREPNSPDTQAVDFAEVMP
jgi:hypothetical protein